MQMNRASALNRATLLLGASATALLFASPAFAKVANQPAPPPADQTTPPANQQAVPPTADAQQAAQTPPQTQLPAGGGDSAVTASPNSIVVTGTRIRQPEFTSPDPVATINPTIAKASGQLDTAEMLQSSPIADVSALFNAKPALRDFLKNTNAKFHERTPLWFYVLAEAEAGGGNRLGEVGSCLVALTSSASCFPTRTLRFREDLHRVKAPSECPIIPRSIQ